MDTDPGDSEYGWDLSRDGSRLAVATGNERNHQIRIVSLRDKRGHDLTVKGWTGITWVSWTAEGRALLVSVQSPHGSTLVRVDMAGNGQPLWESRSGYNAYGISSPDGRYMAIGAGIQNSNLWMVENF